MQDSFKILNKNILLIEDDKDIAEMIKIHFGKDHPNWKVDIISSGTKAWMFFKMLNHKMLSDKDLHTSDIPDICILDILLPGNSGFEICKFVRSHPIYNNLPILMLTALATPEYVVQGLEAGADDYVTKPFDIKVLSARIKTLLKKKDFIESSRVVHPGRSHQPDPDIFTFGGDHGLRIYLSQYRVCKGPANATEELNLTLTEFKILLQLIKSGGKVLTRKFLLKVIVGEGIQVTERTIDTHVVSLRKKLTNYAHYLETIRGIGYRMGERCS